MPYYLGIDGGGTQTRAVIVDEAGCVRGSGLAGPSNYHSVGVKGARAALLGAQQKAMQSASLPQTSQFDAACLGLAGCGSEEDRLQLQSIMSALNVRGASSVLIESDLRIAHAGAFEGEAGIVLIAGTGSSCLGVNAQGKVARSGGWGPMFDDRGSGFDIGRMAIIHTLRAADGRDVPSSLAEQVMEKLGGDLRAIARMTATGQDRTRIASLAPLVFAAAALREPCASAIIHVAAEELARMVFAVAKQLEMDNKPIEVVVLGGLNSAGRLFFQSLYDAVRRQLPLASIVSDMMPAVLGAALMAMKHAGITATDEMLSAMKRTYEAMKIQLSPSNPIA